MVYDVIIIGSGPAGYTAAIYASRARLKTLVLSGAEWGGQLMLTTEVENYPGFPDGIMGPELMAGLVKQAERFDSEIRYDDATTVDFSRADKIREVMVGDERLEARSVIITTGASAKWLGLPNEERLRGHGVSSCATCDGFFFRNKEVAVVGGGDVAMEDGIYLTKFANKVTVVHRRHELRASKIMQDRALANPKMEFAWDSVVSDVVGGDSVTAVKLRNVHTRHVSELPVSGLFVAIGHEPNTSIFRGHIDMDDHGYIRWHRHTMTNVEGVFAAGDVVDRRYRQAVVAAGDGCRAAMDAEKYLEAWDHQQH